MNTFIHQRQKTDNTDRDTNTKSNIVPTIQFALFEKNDPLRGNLLDFVPKRFIATPIYVLYANFVKFGRPEIGKVVRYLPHKKNKISPRSLALASARVAPKICQGQRQPMFSERPKFHTNRFTSGGVIAERVNTVETYRKVFTIFGCLS